MTLFPDAVLVDTITCFPCASALIAIAWWTYRSPMLRADLRVCVMVAESGVSRVPVKCMVFRAYNPEAISDKTVPIRPSLASNTRRSMICFLYQGCVSISEMSASIEGRSLESGTAFSLPLPRSNAGGAASWLGFTGIWSLAAASNSATACSLGGVARSSLSIACQYPP